MTNNVNEIYVGSFINKRATHCFVPLTLATTIKRFDGKLKSNAIKSNFSIIYLLYIY